MIQPAIISAIHQVLHKHECAVIPGFGAFILRKNFGLANQFSGQIKPSIHTIYFNSDIQEDDGFVANELKESQGYGFRQASELLHDAIQELKNQCNRGISVPLDSLGHFHRNSNGELFFLADPSLNLSKSTFGLPILDAKWNADVKNQNGFLPQNSETLNSPTVSTSINDALVTNFRSVKLNIAEENNSKFTASKRKQPLLWRAAASFAIISVGAGVLLSVLQIWSVALNTNLASLLPFGTEVKPIVMLSKPMTNQEMVNQTDDHFKTGKDQPSKGLKYGNGDEGMKNFKSYLASASGKYIIFGGSYITESLAINECKLWQRIGNDACVVKVRNSSLSKVILGRFKKEQIASDFAETIKIMPTGTLSVSEIALDWNK